MVGIGMGMVLLFGFARLNLMPVSQAGGGFANQFAGPVVLVDRTEWDFGNVGSGNVRAAKFEIRNIGNTRLILRKTTGDCDCVAIGEAEIILEPGDRRAVVAKLDTNKSLGPVQIGLHYQTNDPRQPRLSLLCFANIVREQ